MADDLIEYRDQFEKLNREIRGFFGNLITYVGNCQSMVKALEEETDSKENYEEVIRVLKLRIKDADAKIEQLSRDLTAERTDHIADIHDLKSKVERLEQDKAELAATIDDLDEALKQSITAEEIKKHVLEMEKMKRDLKDQEAKILELELKNSKLKKTVEELMSDY